MIPTRSREHSWRYEIWDRDGFTGQYLKGIKGGSLEWQKNQAIKGRGTLDSEQAQNPSLLDKFIRPVLTIEGWGTRPYGLWVPSFPTRNFDATSWRGPIALLSYEALLSYTSAASILNSNNDISVIIPQGTVVTDWIKNALTTMGINRFIIQASPKTENAPQAYVEGETMLQVINAELDRIGYSSIYTDMEGVLRADPYVLPGDRPESFSNLRPFDAVDGNPIFLKTFTVTDDAASVPNRVRAVGQPVGWLPGQTAVAVNNDPDSPYSVVNRGYIVEKVYTGVNALSQAEVQSYANRQLLNLSKDGRKAEVEFLHLPGLTINNVVKFNTARVGESMMATVDSLTVDTRREGNSRAVLTAVTAVQEDSA